MVTSKKTDTAGWKVGDLWYVMVHCLINSTIWLAIDPNTLQYDHMQIDPMSKTNWRENQNIGESWLFLAKVNILARELNSKEL